MHIIFNKMYKLLFMYQTAWPIYIQQIWERELFRYVWIRNQSIQFTKISLENLASEFSDYHDSFSHSATISLYSQHFNFYKITKIVGALWLAERNVCMRVCRHGCVVKKFCFSRANHAKHEFEKVFELKTRQVYFIYPFLRRLKLGKSLQRRCVNFFSLKLTF